MSDRVERPVSLENVVLPEKLPPLMLVAFTRSDLLQDVLEAIEKQTLLPQEIIAFVDGARKAEDEPLIAQCISLLENFSTSISVPVKIIARTENLGCDRNVISGCTEVLSSSDSLVYLEDDNVPNPYFYDRMCRLLQVYRDCQEIGSISAYASLPANLSTLKIETDVMVSNRFFSWGFGTWRDRWQEFDLVNQSLQYNPFGSFYKIPATLQTKMTAINQFWIEKNQQTDWVIMFTLAALYHKKKHIIPINSLVYNNGFGHPQAKTYKGKEKPWVNTRYADDFCPNTLPPSLELAEQLKPVLDNIDLIQHLSKQKGLWLNPSAFLYLLKKSESIRSMALLFGLFINRLPIMLKRWRRGLPI